MAITEQELKKALSKGFDLQFLNVPAETEIEHIFSQGFEARMQRLEAKNKNGYWHFINTAAKRAACFFLGLFAVFSLGVSVDAIRLPAVELAVKIFDIYNEYYFDGDTTQKIEHEYKITRIPEGFIKTSESKTEASVNYTYINGAGDKIIYSQTITADTGVFLDNEHGKIYTLLLGDIKVNAYEHPEVKHLMWLKDGYLFELTAYGEVTVQTLTDIISGIE
ncbi:MAG: DUF4367 domain-containing protein [Clostridia bacterium]|nr:DUF4367 domain-containing protein [Clostridia bacterium]